MGKRGSNNRSLQERFDEKYVPVTESGCWLWTGSSNRYGHLRVPSAAKAFRAHRVSYELHKGSIPKGMNVLHRCDVTLCVNPDHLFIGTQTDNMRDMIAKSRQVTSPLAGMHGNHASGENSGQCRCPDRVVSEMRHAHSSGLITNIAMLARMYRLSESQVRRIVWRQSRNV